MSRLVGAAAAVALLGALAGCATPAPPAAAPNPLLAAAATSLSAAPCAADAFADLGLPADGIWCGELVVPLDRAEPDGEQLRLAVTMNAPADPSNVMVVLGGGPGGDAIWTVPEIVAILPEVAATTQLVSIDQRGTGATALDCPDVQAQTGSSDIRPASSDAVAACAVRIADERAHLATSDSVADLEALRQALGAPRWVLNGTSYGTFVAMRYAVAEPDAVAGLVLDSVVPVEAVEPFLLSSMQATGPVLTAACAASDCGTDPVADLRAVIAGGYDELRLLDAIVGMSVSQPDFPGLFDALAAARAGNTAPLDALVAESEANAASPVAQFSSAAHIATLCLDTPMPWSTTVTDPAARAAALDAAVDALEPADTDPFTPAVAGREAMATACVVWPESAEPFDGELPDVPALLLAGDRDLSTPMADTAAVATAFPRGTLVVVPGGGHGVQTSPEGAAALTSFLAAV